MKLQVVSDLHVDTQPYKPVLERVLVPNHEKYLVLAGDVAETRSPEWLRFYRDVAAEYERVVCVLGNHEHYFSTLDQVAEKVAALPRNVTVLQEQKIELEGYWVGGSTLWFEPKFRRKLCDWLPDFKAIPDFESWVYRKNEAAHQFLDQPLDLVITHHLPCWEAVDPAFAGADSNVFFVSDCGYLFDEHDYQFWVHGHAHRYCRFKKGTAEVLRNPGGYRYESRDLKHSVIELI